MKKSFLFLIGFVMICGGFLPSKADDVSDLLMKQNTQQIQMDKYEASKQLSDYKTNLMKSLGETEDSTSKYAPKRDLMNERRQNMIRMYGPSTRLRY
jgi:hypothetical protein